MSQQSNSHDNIDLSTIDYYKERMAAVMKFEDFPGRNMVTVFEQICDVIPENFSTKTQMRKEAYSLFDQTIIWHSLRNSWGHLAHILEKYLDTVNEPWVDTAVLILQDRVSDPISQ